VGTGLPGKPLSSRKTDYVWVLASGPAVDIDIALRYAAPADVVIAADGGTVLANRLGITPSLIIGDLDSTPAELVNKCTDLGTEVRRYDHDTKWETDTELALLAALDYSPKSIFLLGGIGGRLDHSLANVLLLTHPQFVSLDLHILDGSNELFLAKPKKWNKIKGDTNDIVSLLPIGASANAVTTRGLQWPLNGETLVAGKARGVSNRISDPATAAVRYDAGLLLVAVVHET
jgi:thiamine pyrophosphokinase